MARVTNYFETQIKIIEDPTVDTSAVAGGKSSVAVPLTKSSAVQPIAGRRPLAQKRLRYVSKYIYMTLNVNLMSGYR